MVKASAPGNRSHGSARGQGSGPAPPVRPAGRSPRAIILAGAGLLLAGGALGGWWLYRPSVAGSDGTVLGVLPRGVRVQDVNVLFLTLDTTRADRLGCYGEPLKVTPHLDRLGAEGVRFDQVMAPVPLTLPAHATIFTGTVPPAHGVRDNGGYTLDARHPTLATLLKRRGRWATGAFVGAFVLDSKWGLDQGFDTYFDDFDLARYTSISLGDVSRTAQEVVDQALPWLDQHASERFFAWLHFYDPHSPTNHRSPTRRGSPIARTSGRSLTWMRRSAGCSPGSMDAGSPAAPSSSRSATTARASTSTARERTACSSTTPPCGCRSSSALRTDRLRGRTVQSLVRSEDVMPTVLDLLQVEPPRGIHGRSLVPLMGGAVSDLNLDGYAETYYPRFHYGWSELRALRAGRFKYIEAPRPELYDIELDPGETKNLYEERRALADRMAAELRTLEAATAAAKPAGQPSIDPETRERLAALGYIGTFSEAPRSPGTQLADPKDKIDVFNLLLSAREESASGARTLSIEKLETVIATDPDIIDAWTLLGNAYVRRGEPARALECYRRALTLKPDYDLATINMANAYRELGQHDAAIAGYKRYLQNDPKNAYVHYQLGELYMDTKNLDKAAGAFRRALDLDPRLASARNALGVVAFARGDLDTSEREVRAALEQKPDVRLAHYNLALLAERRGDVQAALAEYRRETEIHPDSFKAEFNLGRLYEQMRGPPEPARGVQTGARGEPAVRRRLLLPGEALSGPGAELRRSGAGREKGARDRAGVRVRAAQGHYVLADIYNRQGRRADAEREAGRAAGRSRPVRNLEREPHPLARDVLPRRAAPGSCG